MKTSNTTAPAIAKNKSIMVLPVQAAALTAGEEGSKAVIDKSIPSLQIEQPVAKPVVTAEKPATPKKRAAAPAAKKAAAKDKPVAAKAAAPAKSTPKSTKVAPAKAAVKPKAAVAETATVEAKQTPVKSDAVKPVAKAKKAKTKVDLTRELIESQLKLKSVGGDFDKLDRKKITTVLQEKHNMSQGQSSTYYHNEVRAQKTKAGIEIKRRAKA